MLVKKLRGFKYPDVELVRWFFKHEIHKVKRKKVLEFGTHNGNNLSLFAGYGFRCWGVDLEGQNIQNARHNFSKIYRFKRAEFVRADMRDFKANAKRIKAGVFLLPNVINYISKEDFKALLSNARANKLYAWGREKGGGEKFSHFFCRARSVRDHRYGLGRRLENGSFELSLDEFSGEKNLLCTAYEEWELVELLRENLNLFDFELITSENINVKNQAFIKDADIIIYGKIK